ncbi:hypothetical protein Glove_74g328 [Diversispora epigaea]|nr:hypothetical protein Glove_74g328 [Diversispora epigaea]
MNCNFITDSGEFQENSSDECKLILNKNENEIPILSNSNTELITKQFCYILPYPPLQNSNNNQFFFTSTSHSSSTKKQPNLIKY